MLTSTSKKTKQKLLNDALDNINNAVVEDKEPDSIKINIGSVFNTPLLAIQNETVPRYKKTYITLDRRSTPIESSDYKTFTWNITHRKDNRTPGTIYLPPDIKKIKQIRIMPFKFNTDMTSTNLQVANMPFTVNIPELHQGFNIGNERFQFIGKPIFPGMLRTSDMIIVFDKGNKHEHYNIYPIDSYNPSYYVNNSSYNQGVFTLEDDFTFSSTISVQFGFPFKKIALKQARFPITSQSLPPGTLIPTKFNIDNPNNATASTDTFYIENLTYAGPATTENTLALSLFGNNFLGWRGSLSDTISVSWDAVQPGITPNIDYTFYNWSVGPFPVVTSGEIYSARLGFEICFEIIYEV